MSHNNNAMSKLTTATTKRTFAVISLAASLMVAVIAFSANSHGVSAQSLTSSLKQKASNVLGGGANKTAGNTTSSGSSGSSGTNDSTASSLKQKASGIIGKFTSK
jgi:hypothetical protein